MPETPLPGGFATTVVRVGDTVRRAPSKRAAFVHRLLELFAQRGWPGAPRFLGVDGHVGWERVQPPEVWSDASLVRVAERREELEAGIGSADSASQSPEM